MNDPVSEELERRAHFDLGWRWALAGAAAIHLAVASVILIAPSSSRRALTLPHVQVRIAAPPVAGGAAAGKTTAVSAPAKPAPQPAPEKRKGHQPDEHPSKHPIPDKRAPQRTDVPLPAAPPAAAESARGDSAGTESLSGMKTVTSASGGIALDAGGRGDAAFPFAYYLNRTLAAIEGNWFRPPAPAGTTCRVRCIIDRTGRLIEAGLETESQTPAFDRATLRAVYASAPFPPLPQGFGGSTLTLHLEFGQ